MIDIIIKDVKQAMKDKNLVVLTVLRSLKAALDNEKISLRRELTNTESITVVKREIKKRKDSVQQFSSGGRFDLADKEAAEIIVLEKYLPKQKTDEEIKEIVGLSAVAIAATNKKDMGRLMKAINTAYPGEIDGKKLSEIVQKYLNN